MAVYQSVSPSRVLVIGAGVAGCAAAIRLAHLGNAVTLAERAVFPREKICGCCLGAAGLQALDAIGLGNDVREQGATTNRFATYLETSRSLHANACSLAIRLPIAAGTAISRSVLDSFLVEQAALAGVRVWQPHEAQVVSTEGDRTLVRHRRVTDSQSRSDWQFTDEFELVVVATGLSGDFSGTSPSGDVAQPARRWQLPWIQPPHGPLGIGAHLPGTHPLACGWDLEWGEIQMVCGDEGYVGLVRLPDGAIDIAAALQSRRPGAGDTIDRLVSLLLRHPGISEHERDAFTVWLREDARLMTAPPLRRSRSSGRDRVVLIGDSAGYVEPMTGEGMTWGIESGLAVADLWASQLLRADFARHWRKRLQRLQYKRRILCGGVTRAMRSAWLRQAAGVGLTHAPWLARPITRGLAAGPNFLSSARPRS